MDTETEKFLEFLRERGVEERYVEKIIDEKVDCGAIKGMDDTELKLFIPKFGDRVAVRNFVQKRTEETDQTGRRKSVLERLRAKLKVKNQAPETVPEQQPAHKQKRRLERRVKIGLLLWNSDIKIFNQVRARRGGGTRKVYLKLTNKKKDIQEIAEQMFFPNGMSPKLGSLFRYERTILDFNEEVLGGETLEEIIEMTKVNVPRLYLAVKKNSGESVNTPEPEGVPSDDSIFDVVEESNSETNSDSCSLVSEDIDTDVSFSAQLGPEASASDGFLSLPDMLHQLTEQIKTTELFPINVNRENVMEGFIRGTSRKNYSPDKKLSIKFNDVLDVGEGAVDQGGPMREFFRLGISQLLQSNVFEGPSNQRQLSSNRTLLQDERYFHAGKLFALSLLHGGPGPRAFSDFLYESLFAEPQKGEVTVEVITDASIREKIEKLLESNSLDDVNCAIDNLSDVISLAGCWNRVMTVDDKNCLASNLLHFCAVVTKRESMVQFRRGLSTLGCLEAMRICPFLFKPLFCYSEERLTSDAITRCFKLEVSPPDTNKRRKENVTIGFWRDLLAECESGDAVLQDGDEETTLSLADVLTFGTGADCFPPLGFLPEPKIDFMHEEGNDKKFPKANTCANKIILPTMHTTYNTFKWHVIYGITCSRGFGFA